MDEIKDQKADATPEGQDLSKGAESNSKPQTITLEEHKKLLEDAIAQYGDKVKRERIDPIIKERDEAKSKVGQLEADIEFHKSSKEDSEKRIEELESDLETATNDNVDLKDVQKIKRELRAEREKARQQARDEKIAQAELRRQLESEREQWAGTVAEAQAAKFEVDVFEVAEEYVDGAGKDIAPERLKSLCQTAGITSRSSIEEIAKTLWVKKSEAPPMVSDSNVTDGAGGGLTPEMVSKMSPDERFARRKEIDNMLANL